ncbi:hypothetical protein HMPREF3226_02719 [Prevotella corporis]|uniref:Uncharacterized protein n=1 Tax=Prevotella corporis TaxID=28128 RepID=A0A133PTR3_9BACT|nr:hypothetical protein HMPREF3226_02719 [Prevotella corporis]
MEIERRCKIILPPHPDTLAFARSKVNFRHMKGKLLHLKT